MICARCRTVIASEDVAGHDALDRALCADCACDDELSPPRPWWPDALVILGAAAVAVALLWEAVGGGW